MKPKVLTIILFGTLLFISTNVEAQIFKLPKHYRQSLNVDSLVSNNPEGLIFFPEVNVYPHKQPKTKRERKNYEKLVRNFIKVYPYVCELSDTYRNIDDTLAMFRHDNDRDKYLKVREGQIMRYYKPIFSRFTLSQGVLMVKLMDRESGSTAYEVVNELKGSITAFFWQSFALLFGNNLKTEYDASGNDREIEYLVLRFKDRTL